MRLLRRLRRDRYDLRKFRCERRGSFGLLQTADQKRQFSFTLLLLECCPFDIGFGGDLEFVPQVTERVVSILDLSLRTKSGKSSRVG